MIRILVFFALLLALAFGFAQVADMAGHVIIAVGATEYRLSLITALIAGLVLIMAIMLLWGLFRLVFRLPGLLGFASRMRRQSKGQQAVARGLVAIGVGDQRLAERYAADAQKLLGREPLALLLKAQAAQLAGNAKAAEATFKQMLDAPETAGLGLRGLFVEAQRRNDPEAARLFAEEAYRRMPQASWASEAVLGFRAAARDWRGAVAIIDQSMSRRLIDRETGRQQRATLLAAEALEQQAQAPDDALALAQEALRLDPGLVPAADLVARRHSARGDFAKATKVLEAAWKIGPHPDLADAYLHARPGDSALDRLKRARALLKLQPRSRESRFAVTRAALDAREFATAREALDALVLERATARACLLMAELEEMESQNQALVRAWLARASRAPRDPAWVADHVVSETWQPYAPESGRIGAFIWTEPPQASEQSLRARIDADRFEQIMTLPEPSTAMIDHAEPASEPAMAEVASAPPADIEESPVSVTSPALAEAEAVVQAASQQASSDAGLRQPFIPDDPGPEPGAPPPKKRFSLFGG